MAEGTSLVEGNGETHGEAGGESFAGTRVGGFKKRLRTNTLTQDDRDALMLARAIREARAQNVSMKALATQLGIAYGKLMAFAGRGMFAACVEYLEATEGSDDEKVKARVEREQQAEWDALRPKALKFMRDALAEREIEDPETGERQVVWSNPAMAMWATEQITKGAGWNQPKVVKTTGVTLNVSFITHQSAMMDEDEEAPLDPAKDRELSAEEYHGIEDEEDE